jgi:hypothetical protein
MKLPSEKLTLVIIAFMVTISRLFFIGTSYGSGADAWRVVVASRHLNSTGVYVPSRFPGYPLPEYFYTILLKVGLSSAFMFELPVAILSGIAVGLFFFLLLPFGQIAAIGLSLSLAFTPVFFIGSIEAIDYMYGFAFFMAATLAAFRGAVLWSSLFLGLAAASRPTYAFAYIPLALVLLDFRVDRDTISRSFHKLILFSVLSGGTALIFYAQLFYEYGISFLTFDDSSRPNYFQILRQLPHDVFGQIGERGIVLTVTASALAVFKTGSKIPHHRRVFLFSSTTAAIFFLLFLRLPDETAYLIPTIPAFYVWLGLIVPPRWTLALPVFLLASCFLVLNHENGRVRLVGEGPILMDQRYQQNFQCIANEVAIKARALGANTYIASGFLLPTLQVLLPDNLSSHLVYSIKTATMLPASSRFLTIDRVNSDSRVPILDTVDTITRCPR